MSLHYIYSDAVGSTIDVTGRCRVSEAHPLKEDAEEGSVPICKLIIDDPLGEIEFTGHRRFYIYEDLAPVGDQVIYYGWTSNESVARGPNRVGTGRQWTIDLADPNVLLNRRIMNGTDASRPAENDFERMTALLGMTELDTISDTTFVNASAATTAMDACDYRGQNVGQYIDDCRQATGKNAYVYYSEGVGGWGLWYDFATSTAYDSGCFITTDEAQEVDGTTTFGFSIERTNLNRDPSRVASGIYLDWEGKPPVYVQDTDTRDAFTAIDWAAPSLNVKSSAKATARANRYLNDADEEHHVIHTVLTKVPRASVNAIKKGQLVQFKAEWMPGFLTYQTCRVLYRTVMEISEDPTASFEIEMDLDPQPLVCPDATEALTFARLTATVTPSGSSINSDALGNVHYWRAGVGVPEVPTPNYDHGSWHFPNYNLASVDYGMAALTNALRIIVVGDGTLSIPTVTKITSYGLVATLQHRDGGKVTDEVQTGMSGDTFVFDVDTHEATFCVHWVDITEGIPSHGSGNAAGFGGGATWVPA